MSAVPGDPASTSACAGTVRAVASALADHAEPLADSVRGAAEGWPGRVSATTRRRGESLAAAAGSTSAALDAVGLVLQDHATDLADLHARARRVAERAAAAGLEVRDGRVAARYGIAGEADPGDAGRRAAATAALQAELDAVTARHARRRDWVLGVLRSSTDELAAVSRALRRG